MKLYSFVASVKEKNHIPKGTIGIVIFIYDFSTYEVEFFDDCGRTIGLETVKEDDIKLVR